MSAASSRKTSRFLSAAFVFKSSNPLSIRLNLQLKLVWGRCRCPVRSFGLGKHLISKHLWYLAYGRANNRGLDVASYKISKLRSWTRLWK